MVLNPFHVFALVFLICLAGYCTHLWLSFQHNQGDELILPIVLLLVGISWTFVARIRPELEVRHLTSIMVGFCGLGLASMSSVFSMIRRYVYVLLAFVAGLLSLTLLVGSEYGGSRGWLNLGLFTIQPAEFARLVFILFVAEILSRYGNKNENSQKAGRLCFIIVSVVWGILSLLFVLQNDFGAFFVMTSALIVMLYVTLDKFRVLITGVITAFGLLGAAYWGVPHVRARFNNWLNPWDNMHEQGLQLVQSLFGLGNGGLSGVGFGLGRTASVPAAHTDLVFSVIHEELGFLGACAFILLYCFLIYRGFRIALLCDDKFQQLVVVGICTMLGFQTICMITGSTGLFPLSGLVMPFLSFGGTGMVTNLVMAGLLLTVPNLKVNRMKTKSVLYVLFIFLLGFLVCFCYLTYIQIFKVTWLVEHPANVGSIMWVSKIYQPCTTGLSEFYLG